MRLITNYDKIWLFNENKEYGLVHAVEEGLINPPRSDVNDTGGNPAIQGSIPLFRYGVGICHVTRWNCDDIDACDFYAVDLTGSSNHRNNDFRVGLWDTKGITEHPI